MIIIRDPNRINEVALALAECWSKFPDLRFGQLVSNINSSYIGGDIFFPEDNIWLKAIKNYQEDYQSKYVSK